jgi:cytochrome P450
MSQHYDPFKESRNASGLQVVHCDGEDVPLVLRLQDVRRVANDWKSFSSDHPFKVILHSEENVRSVRQLPIEIDPPEHTDYRKLVEPLFRKPADPAYQERIASLVHREVTRAIEASNLEIVHELALPIQSRALTHLLGMPESEADIWIGWGLHVFHHTDESEAKGAALDQYVEAQFARAEHQPGDDFFSILNEADFRDRKLTTEEKAGFASVTFAGGRDTIISTISSIIVYLSEHPEAIDFLRADENRLSMATEEFVRFVSPLTAISRTCPHAATVANTTMPAGTRIALCWPSANRDEKSFQDANEIVLDRKPNPHVGFGFGPHNCLGAPHARLLIRSLLKSICDLVDRVEVTSSEPLIETESSYVRQIGYRTVSARLIGK